ncbi:hypothetical protein [Nocardia callitridis]|uniref:hypothetical protein n=1 Tax=Nocardia callitridis TaxID=648753 RepID=UPI0031E614EB
MVTFALFFQPWLTASGRNGTITTDAFATMGGVTNGVDGWGADGFGDLYLSGVWAVLASAAIITALFATIVGLRARNATLATVVAFAYVAAAVCVLIAMLYFNSKVPELRHVLAHGNNFSTKLGSLVDGFTGDAQTGGTPGRNIASAGLSRFAVLGGITASGAAIIAAAQWLTPREEYVREIVVEKATAAEPQQAQSPSEPPRVVVPAAMPVAPPQPATPALAQEQGELLWEELTFDDALFESVNTPRPRATIDRRLRPYRRPPNRTPASTP